MLRINSTRAETARRSFHLHTAKRYHDFHRLLEIRQTGIYFESVSASVRLPDDVAAQLWKPRAHVYRTDQPMWFKQVSVLMVSFSVTSF